MHGVKESENENIDVVVTETLNELLPEKLKDVDIDRSHQIGKLKMGKQLNLPGTAFETEYLKTIKI